MFLPVEDLNEVRIFRSRVIRITEHRIVCPVHLREEIASIISETVSVRSGKKTFFEELGKAELEICSHPLGFCNSSL